MVQRLSQGFHFAGIERIPTDAAPGMKMRWTVGGNSLGYFSYEFSPSIEFERGPRFRRLQFVTELPRRTPGSDEVAEQAEGSEFARIVGRMQHSCVPVEPIATVSQPLYEGRLSAGLRRRHRPRALQFLKKHALVGFARMKLQRERAQSNIPEAPVNDVERSHLLSNEKHCLALGSRRRDNVRDGLRLAGAWRPLDDEMSSSCHFFDRNGLRGVGVDDVVHRHRLNDRIDVAVV